MGIDCKLVTLILVLATYDRAFAGKIFNGQEATPHSRPYMALLRPLGCSSLWCGGFLVKEDFVMTAAHCDAECYEVILGLHDYHNQGGTQKMRVAQRFPHKDYNAAGYKNDIMLLKLSSKAKINSKVATIELAGKYWGSLPQSCSVSGWGKSDRNNRYNSVKLMEVNVTLIEKKACAVKKNQYCSENETGPGQGDSGGPLVCEDGKAFGVISAGTNGPKYLYRYTKIIDYLDWIDCIIHNEEKCKFV
ncbi:granzyme B(G,H)-like [Pholidichthys leucotaenia]